MAYLDDFVTALVQWENRIPWLYRDSVGLFTTSEGLQLPNLAASLALPWYVPDFSRPATEAEVAADWARVAALPADMAAPHYHAASSLMLQQSDMTAMTLKLAQKQDVELAADYPTYTAAPDPAKIALLDMDWNLGERRLLNTYPHFDAAFNARDWAACAKECARNPTQASFAKRNAWTVQQFEAAAAMS